MHEPAGTWSRSDYNAAMSTVPPARHLERRLGPVDAAAIVISNVIGVGIFTTPGIIAQIVPHPVAMSERLARRGLLAFAGAMAYAELAALRPKAGGEYVYLREGFGSLAAFLTGWTSFIAGFAGAIAAAAVGAAEYLARFVPAAGDQTVIFSVPLGFGSLTLDPRAVVALVLIRGLSYIHLRGLGPGRIVQNTLAGTQGRLARPAGRRRFRAGQRIGRPLCDGRADPSRPRGCIAMIPVMFSYSGWNAACVRRRGGARPGPQRATRPRARHGRGRRPLSGTQRALSLRPARQRVHPARTGGAGHRRQRRRRTAARSLGRRTAGDPDRRHRDGEHQRHDARRSAGSTTRWRATACSSPSPRASTRVTTRRRRPSSRRPSWASVLVLTGTFGQLLTYTGFAVVLFSGIAVMRAVRAAVALSR